MTSSRWASTLRRVLATAIGSALVLGAIIGAGHAAHERIAANERYLTFFHDIECSAPPGRSTNEFLDEVRYLAELPERLDVLDPALVDRLTEAFGRHPRVAEVGRIRLTPPANIQLELRFRPAKSSSVMRPVSRLP